MSRDPKIYLHDILVACEKVLRYTEGIDREDLDSDEMLHDALVRNVLVIGEAAKNVPDDVRGRMPDVDWRGIAGMRDVLVHGYYRIDDDTLWTTVRDEVPELAEAVRSYLDRA